MRVALYAMWGGIAGYWKAIGKMATLEEEIKKHWLTTVSAFHGDPQLLLQDNAADHERSFSIIRKIANGYREPGKIARSIGLTSSTQISPYLEKLTSSRIIEKRLPVTASEKSRIGRYHVRDPFLRFYFRFIEPSGKDIEAGEINQAYHKINKHLDEFIGKHTWEELCREWVLRAGNRGKLACAPEKTGALWNKEAQIDVAALNIEEKHIMLGECKWTEKPINGPVMRGLLDRSAKLIPHNKNWSVTLFYFSKTGFTSGTAAAAEELVGEEGKNWRVTGLNLLSLDEIDADLVEWAHEQ
jgi:AAA+ ATPase superfamily predicted ATPase